MTYRRLPSLNALRAFEAAARHRSVTRAADELGVTPGAVSRQVRGLEEDLGLVLFSRGPAGLVPTEAGRVLQQSCGGALDRMEAGVAKAREAAKPVLLSVGAYAHFASRWLIPRWGRFRERHPGLEIALTTSADPLELLPGQFDAVIAVAEDRPRPGFWTHRLLPIEMVPVCAPSLLGPGRFRWEGQTLLHSRQRPRDWARWLAAQGVAGVDAEAGPSFESISLAVDAACEGLGVALAIQGLIGADLAAGRVVVPVPGVRRSSRSFVLMVEAARRQEPALCRFCDWLVEEAARDAAPAATS
ncbi:LysR family transcriptional regulator [Roseomonas hellenica]|uniref:LysR family transcriptional regulator n=1 Tax=Plastoroseomonas hellenica TaxID=2687306 RepID=A0ABS5EWE8_9PROT|nr:LysR substrate-binding domain-containing protein [Plastoroseomonas hellenica]MBR0664626.1 LysR family transcriptional regulator [Plastoroseomonas hellenica]